MGVGCDLLLLCSDVKTNHGKIAIERHTCKIGFIQKALSLYAPFLGIFPLWQCKAGVFPLALYNALNAIQLLLQAL